MNSFVWENVDTLLKKPPVVVPEPIPPTLHHPEALTHNGHLILWIVFGLFSVGTVASFAVTYREPYRRRFLPSLGLLVNIIATIAYFCMASGVGSTIVHSGGPRSAKREVLYARYIDWLFTTPLLLTELTFLAGLPAAEIASTVVADVIMIVTGLLAALHPSLRYRWGLFTFSLLAFLFVLYSLVGNARSNAFLRGNKVGTLYNYLSGVLVVAWSAYVVVWVLGEGTGIISADSEVLAYGILDVLAKPVWGLALVLALPTEAEVLLPAWAATPGGGYGAVASSETAA
ncbi:Rhodopsin, retinal binding site [Ceraceosorus bombacis]|uniref:Rhodopsin, retinal binding site n=1 Tax=Ceraceosorus bombacis TaxID=401625 RepID=A0A0P1BG63_9BASI|nr:Rhodopsin, retinal binding site [Ceraceosorus bombacis]